MRGGPRICATHLVSGRSAGSVTHGALPISWASSPMRSAPTWGLPPARLTGRPRPLPRRRKLRVALVQDQHRDAPIRQTNPGSRVPRLARIRLRSSRDFAVHLCPFAPRPGGHRGAPALPAPQPRSGTQALGSTASPYDLAAAANFSSRGSRVRASRVASRSRTHDSSDNDERDDTLRAHPVRE
jgi:hypothetical protein